MGLFPSTLTSWNAASPPPTAARVYYAYKILAKSQIQNAIIPIGTLQNFQPRSTRTIMRNRGIANNSGLPHELVPGPADLSITVQHIMLYHRSLAMAFGYGFLGSALELNLTHIGFDIFEQCFFPIPARDWTLGNPTDILKVKSGGIETVIYQDCMFSDLGRTITTGQVQILENATIQARATTVHKGNITFMEGIADELRQASNLTSP